MALLDETEDEVTPAQPPLNPMVAEYLKNQMAMKQAQEAANQNQLYAGMARAGGTLANAIAGGTKGVDQAGFDALEKNAQSPVQNLAKQQEMALQDAKAQSLKIAAQKQVDDRKKESPQSVAFRKSLEVFPDIKKIYGPQFEDITAADKPYIFDVIKTKELIASRNAQAAATANNRGERDSDNRIANLRKEYTGLPTTKSTQEVAASIQRVRQAASEPSAAGDLALIFNYMKMLDPGSTVREGEFANAQNAAGVPDQILNQYNKIVTGQRLGKGQRADFLKQAEKQYHAQLTAQRTFDDRYSELARKYGGDPSFVIMNYPPANLGESQGMGLPGMGSAQASESQPPAPALDADVLDYAKKHGISNDQAQAIKNKRLGK